MTGPVGEQQSNISGIYIGFKPQDDGQTEHTQKSRFEKLQALVATLFIKAILYVRSCREGSSHLYKDLLKLPDANETLNYIEATEQLNHNQFVEARRIFLRLVLDLAEKNEQKDIPSLEDSDTYLQAVEWAGTDVDNPSNIKRLYHSSDEISTKLLQLGSKDYFRIREKFYNFRKEVVSYENSLSRVWKGPEKDDKLKEAASDLLEIFRRGVQQVRRELSSGASGSSGSSDTPEVQE